MYGGRGAEERGKTGELVIASDLCPKVQICPKTFVQDCSKWTNLRELFETSDVFRNSGDFRISPSIDKVKHVFIYAQRAKTKDMTENPYIFDTFKLNEGNNDSYIQTCRLEYGNGNFYPNMPMKVLVKAESFPI